MIKKRSGEVIIIHLIVQFIKWHHYKKLILFSNLTVLSYATKPDWKTKQLLIHDYLPKKPGLAGLKLEVDKLDIDKLEVISVILIKLSDVLKNEVVKRVNTRNLLKKLVLFRPLILVI